MALRLIYLMISKLVAWLLLRARSDTAKEIEVLVLANSRCFDDGLHRRGRTGPTER